MDDYVKNVPFYFCFIFVLVDGISSSETLVTYSFEDFCNYTEQTIQTKAYVTYNNQIVSSSECEIGFRAVDTQRICVQSINYNVTNCNVTITVYSSHETKVLSCGSSLSNVCARKQEVLKIKLKNADTYTNSGFTLKVYADTDTNLGILLGITLGHVVIVAVIIIIGCFIYCKRRKKRKLPNTMNTKTTSASECPDVISSVPKQTIFSIQTGNLTSYYNEEEFVHEDHPSENRI